jgi:peptide/nickel transport system substrate-binding protein
MRPRMASRLALATAAAAALVLPVAAAPAAMAPPASAAEPKRLVVAVSQTVDTFNPFMSFFAIGYTVSGLAYDSLIDWDSKDFAAKPGIATGWTESPDHLTWTYNIRSDVKFSDGKPLTAKDVEFTFKTMMTNQDARDSSSDLVENFQSVSAPDNTTFVVKLKQPTNQMLALDSAIVPKHIWEKHLKNLGDFTNFDLPMIGSGPFQVSEFKKDQFIRMKANKNYWGGAPAYDELVFRYFKTPDAAVQALITGEVDLVSGLQPAAYKALKKEQNIKLNQAQNRRFSSITFNMGARTKGGKPFGDGHPALKDVRVRKAIQYATRRSTTVWPRRA